MKWREYPRYKDSGVEWLGEVPEDWEVKRLKTLTTFVTSGSRGWAQHYSEEGALFIRIGNISRSSIALDLRDIQFVSPPRGAEVERTRVEKNDVLISITAYIGSIAVVGDDLGEAYINQHIALTRPRTDIVDSKWVGYGLISSVGQTQFRRSLYGGTKEGLGLDDVKNLFLLMPLLAEQRAIAAFLDRETARIDALMGKKQRQIELLQEKRSALISHAVTRGLDPTVETKDSGAEWLGNIPAHWELKRLKFIAKIQTGLTLGKNYKNVPTISRPYLRVANVQDGYLDLNDITEIIIPEGDTKRHELKPGDVLMTEGGDFDKLGRGYVWEGQIDGCLHQNHIFAVRPNHKYLASLYLSTLMTSSYGKAYFTSTSQQTTNLATTNITKLKQFLLPLPNIREQCSILDWLGRNISKIDGLIAKVQESIDRLKEYRTSLISAAVTGRIDVREAGT